MHIVNARRMHTRDNYSSLFVCVCVCVCSQSASCIGHFYSKLNMAIRFLEAFKFKVCNLQICLKWSISRDTTLSRLLAYKSAILSIWLLLQCSHGAWLHCRGRSCYWACPLALYGAHSMLCGNISMHIAKDQLVWHFPARRRHLRGVFCYLFQSS